MKKLNSLLLFVLFAVPVSAINYYVARHGFDTARGSLAEPFRTLTKAATIAKAGDTIFVAGGEYSEMQIKPSYSGSPDAGHIVYCPQPGTGKVTISKSDNNVDDQDVPVFDLSNCNYIWIEGFAFSDMAYLSSCIRLSSSSNCVVSCCQFRNLGNEAVAPWGATAMIWLYNSTDCIVRNCFFDNIFGDAIDFTGQKSQRHLICENTFCNMKGKKRNWSSDKYKYSSAITCSDTSYGNSLICLNHIIGGQDGIWLDRDASHNIVTRNWGDGSQRLVFNESRCAFNWIQENIACNMSQQGYQSARYDDTGWSNDTRWVYNVAFKCKTGFYLHKSKRSEVRGNIAYGCTDYSLVFTDSAAANGPNEFCSNLWYAPSKNNTIQYCGQSITPSSFAAKVSEAGGIYGKSPLFARISQPYDFTLQAESPCLMASDDGISDIGAYPVYGPQNVGCDTMHINNKTQVWFETPLTDAVCGETYTVELRMAKPCQEAVTVVVAPVGGDARLGTDFDMENTAVSFEPGETSKQLTVIFTDNESTHSKLLVLKVSAAAGDQSSFDARSYTAFRIITKTEYEQKHNSDIWAEAEDGTIGSLWTAYNDSRASGSKYITAKTGNNSSEKAPTSQSGWASYTFHANTAGIYVLWLRTICPSANDDSFWLRIDQGDWTYWNGIPISSAWQWNKSSKTFNLSEGSHTLYIAYREDGAKLDKWLLSCSGTQPEGLGGEPSQLDKLMVDGTPAVREYYDLKGQRVGGGAKGLIIVREVMANGTSRTFKTFTPQ